MAAVKRTKSGDGSVDEDLNSRNLFVYGMDAMSKMARSSVAVIGLNGVGAEAAKCLILANIGRVTLVDDSIVSIHDLSTHFYLSPSDVGHNRAAACHKRLQELNPNVDVRIHTSAVTLSLFADHDAVVACAGSLSHHLEWNQLCRSVNPPAAFVLAEARGACFRLFSDFGDEFHTMPGDKPYCYPVAAMQPAAADRATVTVSVSAGSVDARPKDGDAVVFSDVQGATQPNGLPVIFHVSNYIETALAGDSSLGQFDIDIKSLHIGSYTGRGHVKRVILPQTLSFSSLSHCLAHPGPLSARAWRPFLFPAGVSDAANCKSVLTPLRPQRAIARCFCRLESPHATQRRIAARRAGCSAARCIFRRVQGCSLLISPRLCCSVRGRG